MATRCIPQVGSSRKYGIWQERNWKHQFLSKLSASLVTRECQCGSTEPAEGHDQQILRRLTVVDMPGFGDTCLSEEQIYTEMVKCLSFCAPGPHAFLLVVPIGPYTEDADQSILNLAKIFGDDAVKYHTVVLFTKWDQLQGMEFDEYLSDRAMAITKATGYFICKDLQPYSMVDNDRFRQLVHVLEPRYKIPDRSVFTYKHIPNLYNKHRVARKFHVSFKYRIAGSASRCVSNLLSAEIHIPNEYLRDSPAALRNLIDKCGGRYQVFNNLQNSNNPAQVQELLSKVDSMVKQSKSGFYSNAMFEEAEAIREEQRRIMLENKRRGSSGASEQMREEAVRSSRVLERLTRVVVTGVIGLTVGIAFGVSLTPTVAAAVSGKTAMALGAAIGGAIRVVAGSEAKSFKEGASDTIELVVRVGGLALQASLGVGACLGACLGPAPPSWNFSCGNGAAIVQDTVAAAPVAAARYPVQDTLTSVGKAVAAVTVSSTAAMEIIKCKTKDSEKTTSRGKNEHEQCASDYL
ncbi:uncharacterized protein LOC109532507 [Hippocampus comes]|uniref:uncharacterized protein LOC109532507 n=1 Tax=Hippocampus comes TaxID=109280 RepID=UPI00094ED5DD|nr:PREDICTED: uncharacterized protein LOC109532507 [Hippocampus comes]